MRNTVIGLTLSLLGAAAVSAAPGDRKEAIHLEADRVEIDDKRGISTYSGQVKYSQGSMVLQAENVIIYTQEAPRGKSRRVERMIATGKPATFRQATGNAQEEIRAAAQKIEYEVSGERLFFSGAAHLWKGGNEFTGNTIEYFAGTQTVRAAGTSAGQDRVRVILQPRNEDDSPAVSPSP